MKNPEFTSRRNFVKSLSFLSGSGVLAGSLPALSCSLAFKDEQASDPADGFETGNSYLVDPAITGSYLRNLQWNADSPAANERRRQARFDRIRERSLISRKVEAGPLALELGLSPEGDHIMAWYRILSLDGTWPGGDYVLESLQLVFDTDSLGEQIKAEMMVEDFRGFKAYKRRWGIGFPRQPMVRHLPLLAGKYHMSIRIRSSVAGRPTKKQAIDIGQVTIPEGLCWPGYGPTNGLLVCWPDYDLYADYPQLPPAAGVNVPGWLEPYFNTLDEAIEYVRRWHQCPFSTSNVYSSRVPAEGHFWNSRYLGFYLGAFVPAYLLTGEPRYFQMCEYLYNTILNNIYPTFWDGPVVTHKAGTGQGLLYHGIIARPVIHLARMLDNPELARPMYDIYAAWPRDPEHPERLINVVYPDLTEQRRNFNYNQVMSSLAAVWPLAKIFNDEDLLQSTESVWYKTMRPGMQTGGYWFYNEGGEVVTQHYDLVMKFDASTWLEYPRWADDEDFCSVMRQSADYAISRYAKKVDNMLVWEALRAGKALSSYALGKAGMTSMLCTRLYKTGFTEYAEPVRQSARFIERIRKRPEVRDKWHSSWMCEHVIAPILEATLAGIFQ